MSERYELHLGDCLEVMRGMADGSVDAVITDPPYGGGVASWDGAPLRQGALDEMLRVARGPVVAFGSCMPDQMAACLGLSPAPERIMVWDVTYTQSKARRNGMFYHWQPIYGWRLGKSQGMGDDVIRLPTDNAKQGFVHPGMKPVRVMLRLVSAFGGASVIDPFMGTGTTGVACAKLGCDFVGIEIDAGYFDVARARIEAEAVHVPLPLPATE